MRIWLMKTTMVRDFEPERARRNDLDIHRPVVLAEPHDRALAELPLDLAERGGQGLRLVHGRSFDDTQGRLTHVALLMAGNRPPDNAAPPPRRNRLKEAMYTICSPFAICSF